MCVYKMGYPLECPPRVAIFAHAYISFIQSFKRCTTMSNSNDLYPTTTISQQSLLIETGDGKYLLSEPVDKNTMYQIMLDVIEQDFVREAEIVSPGMLRDYIRVKLARKSKEQFSLMLMDNQHRVIEYRELFYGTVNSCSVYPRIIVECCIESNASACILIHNHPSGLPDASEADKQITERIVKALELIDVVVLDHLIAAGTSMLSFAEEGLL